MSDYKKNRKIVKYVMRKLSVGFVACMILGTAILTKDVQAAGELKPSVSEAETDVADAKLAEGEVEKADQEMKKWKYLPSDKKLVYLASLRYKSSEEVKKRFEEIKKEYKSLLLERGNREISEFNSSVKELEKYDELENTEDYKEQIKIWTGDGTDDNKGSKVVGPAYIKAYDEYVNSQNPEIKTIEDKIGDLEYYKIHADIELKTRQVAQWRKKYPENPVIKEKFESDIKQKENETYASQEGSQLAAYYNDNFLKSFYDIYREVRRLQNLEPQPEEPQVEEIGGWKKEDGKWKYTKKDGRRAISEWLWLPVENSDEKVYKYFDREGNSIDQFYEETKDGETKYYLSQSGPFKGYKKGWWTNPENNLVYYFRPATGSRVEGRQHIDGGWKFFRFKSGSQAFGWQYINRSWSYFDNTSGNQVIGKWAWLKLTDGQYNWKYFDGRGINIDQFRKESAGVWLSQTGPEKSYYKGWWTDSSNGQKYYFRTTSGSRVEGRQYIDGNWYYFRKGSGTQAFGRQYVDGVWRYYHDTFGREVR